MLLRWIEKEGFPPGIKVGNTRLWPESEVKAWLAAHQVAAELMRADTIIKAMAGGAVLHTQAS